MNTTIENARREVASWTLEQCSDYVADCHESEGEQRGEFGMGAESMGWNGSEWMAAYDGYRASEDLTCRACEERLAEDRRRNPPVPVLPSHPDDLPF